MFHWTCPMCRANNTSLSDVAGRCCRCSEELFIETDALLSEHPWVVEKYIGRDRWVNKYIEDVSEVGLEVEAYRPQSFPDLEAAKEFLFGGLPAQEVRSQKELCLRFRIRNLQTNEFFIPMVPEPIQIQNRRNESHRFNSVRSRRAQGNHRRAHAYHVD